MTRIAPVLSIVLCLAACGGPGRPAPAPVEEPSACAADPSVAATRRPKPDGTGCMTQEAITALGDACNGGDADACHRYVGCQLLGELGTSPSSAAIAQARGALRTACDGGIAESCRLRVGVVTERGQPMPDDACADLIRGCKLGDESSCFDCGNHCN
jgi:hypothetical protein